MSRIKLIQQIRELTVAMQQARNSHDYDAADALEDQIADLQDALDFEEGDDYEDKHTKSWK